MRGSTLVLSATVGEVTLVLSAEGCWCWVKVQVQVKGGGQAVRILSPGAWEKIGDGGPSFGMKKPPKTKIQKLAMEAPPPT